MSDEPAPAADAPHEKGIRAFFARHKWAGWIIGGLLAAAIYFLWLRSSSSSSGSSGTSGTASNISIPTPGYSSGSGGSTSSTPSGLQGLLNKVSLLTYGEQQAVKAQKATQAELTALEKQIAANKGSTATTSGGTGSAPASPAPASSAPASNSVAAFINGVSQDWLGRNVTSAEASAWQNMYNSIAAQHGTYAARSAIVNYIAKSPEAARNYVISAYEAAHGTAPTALQLQQGISAYNSAAAQGPQAMQQAALKKLALSHSGNVTGAVGYNEAQLLSSNNMGSYQGG